MSFAAPLFLLALAALALPWWLHRRDASKAPRRPWSSLLLLRASETPAAKRQRLTDLLLLALRCALVALAALAFAQPLIERMAGGTVDSAVQVIAIDTSASMQRAGVWDAATAEARAVLDALPAGTTAMLVAVADEVELVAGPQGDRGALRAGLAAQAPGPGRLDKGGLLRRIETLAASRVGDHPLHVYLISDFQQSGFPARFNALLGDRAALSTHVVGGDAHAANLAITGATLSPRADAFDVRVALHSTGAVAGAGVDGRELIALLDGREVARQTVRHDAERTDVADATAGPEVRDQSGGPIPAVVELTVPRPARGEGRLELTLTGSDALAVDDRRYAVLPAAARTAIPLIGDGAALDYLVAAVEAVSGTGSNAFHPSPLATAGLEAYDIESAPVVMLADAGGLSETGAARFERYVRSGGSALMVLGLETARRGSLPVSGLPVAARSPAEGATVSRVAELDVRHPLVSAVPGWRELAVYRTVALADADVGVLVRLDSGAPLLVEQQLGSGRLLILTSALDRDWNDLLVRPAFVSFIAAAIDYLTRQSVPRDVVLGERLTVAAGAVALFAPDGTRALGLDAGRHGATVRLTERGFYELRSGGEHRLIAVNSDLRESDPTPVATQLLRRWETASTATAQRGDVTASQADQAAVHPLGSALLGLLLIVLFAEMLRANSGAAAIRRDGPRHDRASTEFGPGAGRASDATGRSA